MPLYEYECESCGSRIERIQKFSDPPLTTCVTCSGALRKLPSSPAIHFKGSGFYLTDYARKPDASSEKAAEDSKRAEGAKPAEGTGPDAPTPKDPAAKESAPKDSASKPASTSTKKSD